MKKPIESPKPLQWQRIDGVYWSDDERFTIIKDTGRLYNGCWNLHDYKTGRSYHKPTLKECKALPERYILPHENQLSLQSKGDLHETH